MKNLILAALLFAPISGQAAECAGETYSGTIVKVEIEVVGTMGGILGGKVRIEPKNEPVRTYELRREDIVQYYESLDGDDTERAIVGLGAYVDTNYPVSIRYVGRNYYDDLTKVLRDPSRSKQSGNAMHVWKGPGYAGGDQHSFKDVVCSVINDV